MVLILQGRTATLTWTSEDGTQSDAVTGLPLSNDHQLWTGATIDGSGSGVTWPGWIANADGSYTERLLVIGEDGTHLLAMRRM